MVLDRHAFEDVSPMAPLELLVRIFSQVKHPSTLGVFICSYASEYTPELSGKSPPSGLTSLQTTFFGH